MTAESAEPDNTEELPEGVILVQGSLELPVFNRQGERTGSVSVDPKDFGGHISTRLLHEAVIMYHANSRAGTHSTLRRGEVAGSTKKLFRQKGTGNARVGNKRTNKRRGGGTSKGPKPRDYSYRMPKKALRTATRMAILSKFKDQHAIIVDDLALPGVKTKTVATMLKAIQKILDPVVSTPPVEGEEPKKKKKKTWTFLIGTDKLDPVIYKSARNIEGVEILPIHDFNSLVILKQKRLVLTRAAFDALRQPAEEPAAAKA